MGRLPSWLWGVGGLAIGAVLVLGGPALLDEFRTADLDVRTVVERAPVESGTVTTVQAECPDGYALIGGSARADGNFIRRSRPKREEDAWVATAVTFDPPEFARSDLEVRAICTDKDGADTDKVNIPPQE